MEKLEQAISDILDTLLGYDRQPDGTFAYVVTKERSLRFDEAISICRALGRNPLYFYRERNADLDEGE